MVLSRVRLTDFCCFREFEITGLERLSVVIGENDVGKTVLLDGIEVLLDSGAYDSERHPRDRPDGRRAEEVLIEGWFELEDHDTLPEEYGANDGQQLYLKKVFSEGGGEEVFVEGRGYSDERFDTFEDLNRDPQMDLLEEFGLEPEGQQEDRIAQREQLVEEGAIDYEWKVRSVSWSDLAPHLPEVERIAANDYRSPDRMVRSALKKVASAVVQEEDEDGELREREDLRPIREEIEDRLEEEIQKARDQLERQHRGLEDLGVDPKIDFTEVLQDVNLTIDLGEGERPLRSFGDGTKKRVWMGLLEWETETASEEAQGSTIRLYDEPDINLHYEAQRRLFQNIADLTEGEEARTQCVVCTHSVFFIDRAPPQSVNLIRTGPARRRTHHSIEEPSQEGIVNLLDQVGQAVGLSNTAILYEKGFIVVEGESEEAALPVLYQKVTGSTLARDGLRIVNLRTCGAWRSVLQVLLENRMDMVHLLLDADCEQPESSVNLTPEVLEELGCGAAFLDDQLTLIGAKEYEDAFADEVYARALDAEFPRQDGQTWEDRLEEIRSEAEKFSEELKQAVRQEAEPARRSDGTKPNIALVVAKHCHNEEIPEAVEEIFRAVRDRADLA